MATFKQESFLSSDDEEDFEVSFNTQTFTQLIPSPKRIIENSKENETNVNTLNIATNFQKTETFQDKDQLDEEERLKREIWAEAEKMKEERLKREEERRIKMEMMRKKKKRVLDPVVAKPEIREDSELTEKQLQARKRREQQRAEMLKLRKSQRNQVITSDEPQPEELVVVSAPGGSQMESPKKVDPDPLREQHDDLFVGPTTEKAEPSGISESSESSPSFESPAVAVPSPTPITTPVSQEASSFVATTETKEAPVQQPPLSSLQLAQTLLSQSAEPSSGEKKSPDQSLPFSLSSLGLPSLTSVKEQNEDDESLLRMELQFLQKKYDKEVKSRLQLHQMLQEYEKTIQNLVGQLNQAKTQTISNEETLLKDCRLKELGDSLECTQQELQTCQTERDELKQNLQEIEKAKEELSRRTAASELSTQTIENLQKENQQIKEELISVQKRTKEIVVWKAKSKQLQTQLEVAQGIVSIKERENAELTKLCEEALVLVQK